MKKILLAGMLVGSFVGCSAIGQGGQEVQAKTTTKFPYKYKIEGVDMYGNTVPQIGAIIQVEDKFVTVDINFVSSDVAYDKLVGSMLYSAEEIEANQFVYNSKKLKIKEK